MKIFILTGVLLLVFFTGADLYAQSGLFGSRSLGNGISAQQGGFSGSPGDRVESLQSGAGEVSGNERFVRDSRQPGQFVGSDSGDTSNFFSQLGNQFATGGLQGLNRNANRGNTNNSNNRPPLATKLSLGFDPAPRSSSAVSTRLNNLLRKIPQLEEVGPLSVALEGSTLVLSGRVATDYERQMVARIAKQEPGVYFVRNELTVGIDPEDAKVTQAETLPEPTGQVKPISPLEALESQGEGFAPAGPPAPKAPQVKLSN